MNEYNITHLAGLSGLGLVLSAWLWSIGGRGGIAIRRFGSTTVIFLTVLGASYLMHRFSWWLLLLWPCLMPACLKYGGTEIMQKLARRAGFCIANLLGGVALCLIFGGHAWRVFPIHCSIALLTIWFAVLNPIYAPAEEFIVAMLLYLGLIMYPFIA